MALDNQIKLLFPKTYPFIENFMNILLKIEEGQILKLSYFPIPNLKKLL